MRIRMLGVMTVIVLSAVPVMAQVQGTPVAEPARPTVVSGQPVAGVPSEARTRPVIERLEPASGPVGTEVVIVGRNFGPEQRVFFGGREIPIRSVVPTRISVIVPEGSRSGRLAVHGSGGMAESSQTFNVVTPPPVPTITGFVPLGASPGTDVVIEGTAFSLRIYENRVSLSGLVLPVRTASTTQLTVTIPEGAVSGPFRVDVANAGVAESSTPFEVQLALRADRLDPTFGTVGTRVRILGSGFDPDVRGNTVTMGVRRCVVHAASPLELLVEVPTRSVSGSFRVAVRGRGELVTPEFRMVQPASLRSFSPRAGFSGTEVVLQGANLAQAIAEVRVTMSGVMLPVLAASSGEVRVRIPEGAGTAVIQLELQYGGTVVTPSAFEVWSPPAITGFHPSRVVPGSRVAVTGRGFLAGRGLTTVTVGGVSAAVIEVDEGGLAFTVPEGSATGRIRISVRDRGEAETTVDLMVLPAPRITLVAPEGAAPGTELMINGENFGSSVSDVTVTFGSETLVVRSVSPNRIVVAAPAGPGADRLKVTIRNLGEVLSETVRPGRPVVQATPQ